MRGYIKGKAPKNYQPEFPERDQTKRNKDLQMFERTSLIYNCPDCGTMYRCNKVGKFTCPECQTELNLHPAHKQALKLSEEAEDTASEVELYRPTSGTEGENFKANFCYRCKWYDEERGCPIELATTTFEEDDSYYPNQWRYGEDGLPVCMAFWEED